MLNKQRVSLLYAFLGSFFILNGLALLVAPMVWVQIFPLAFLSRSVDVDFALRLLGVVWLAQAPLYFWCARNLKRCSTVRFSLTLQAVALWFVTLSALMITPVPLAPQWPSLVLLGLPCVILGVMMLPGRTVRVRGPRETGQVKWFNANKGFGFITRTTGDDIFVHYRAIRGEGHRTLREGQQVTFALKRGDKGLQADDVEGLA